MHVTHNCATMRAVCKSWLRVSNSLTPFFMNRMEKMQVALTKKARSIHDPYDEEVWQECEAVVAMRLLSRPLIRSLMPALLEQFGIPHGTEVFGGDIPMASALAEQLCNETDDEEDGEDSDTDDEED